MQILENCQFLIWACFACYHLPHTNASSITQAPRNIHAWNPPSTGGSCFPSVESLSDFSGHNCIWASLLGASLQGGELLQDERRVSMLNFVSSWIVTFGAGASSNELAIHYNNWTISGHIVRSLPREIKRWKGWRKTLLKTSQVTEGIPVRRWL